MSYPPALLSSAARQLQRVFEADHLQATDEEELHRHVARMVQHLLRQNLNHLLHILYRIDVEEQQVKQAMLAESEEAVAGNIARLIIKRELQKAQTRFRYSQN